MPTYVHVYYMSCLYIYEWVIGVCVRFGTLAIPPCYRDSKRQGFQAPKSIPRSPRGGAWGAGVTDAATPHPFQNLFMLICEV